MEKLLRLLNIYSQDLLETNLRFTYDGDNLRVQGDEIGPYVAESIVINKKFGFIERLIREGEIDYWSEGWRNTPNYYESSEFGQKIVNDIEKLIIHLSIQDQPIEYLCSILKE